MQHEIDEHDEWSEAYHTNETKEILIGITEKIIRLNDNEIKRGVVYKQLGLYVNVKLTWNDHVTSMCIKPAPQLLLKLLERAGISSDDVLYYYKSVFRPVSEYACSV